MTKSLIFKAINVCVVMNDYGDPFEFKINKIIIKFLFIYILYKKSLFKIQIIFIL